jgi:hypothetical protein
MNPYDLHAMAGAESGNGQGALKAILGLRLLQNLSDEAFTGMANQERKAKGLQCLKVTQDF